MPGKSFERYARSTVTQAEYKEITRQRNMRRMLTGFSKIPKYPDMHYRPESKLYGMQGIGKSQVNYVILKF